MLNTYLRNGTRYTKGYYRPLIKSDMWPILPLPMTLIGLQGYFSYFSLKISVAHFSGPDDLAKDDVLPMTLSDI